MHTQDSPKNMDQQEESFSAAARQPILAITGPTATGKTRLAVELARRFNGEIVSVDSRQVYRGLDLGTGKDLTEYSEGGAAVPVHLVDVAPPGIRFDLYRYLLLAREAIAQIRSRGALPILCGGTPLYLAALLDGYAMEGGEPDQQLRAQLEEKSLPELAAILRQCATPELLQRTDMTQERRIIRAIEIARRPTALPPPPPLSRCCLLAPLYTRTEVRERIRLRLEARFAAGMLQEVQQLRQQPGITPEWLDWLGLEYRYIGRYISGELTYEAMQETLLNRIRQFAKRQDIWFRKLERDGHPIQWIPQGDVTTAAQVVEQFLHDSSASL